MAGAPGFEPGGCQSQSLMPYRLAMPQVEWWRGTDLNRRTRWEMIYSHLRLATSLPLQDKLSIKMVDAEGLEPTTLAL